MLSKIIKKSKKKIVVILGPTSSGKTKLAVDLARKFNGEIVSADSRQVYKGMDVGTGKDLDEYRIKSKVKSQKSKVIDIPYHLIDVVSPKTEFNLAKYQRLAYRAIDDILARGKLPIIAGGTGLYIQSIVDGYQLPGGKPDKKLRARLEKMSAEELFVMLQKLDIKKAKSLNESERGNKRHLIRHVEIAKMAAKKSLQPIPNQVEDRPFIKGGSIKKYDFLMIGLTFPKEVLEKRIYKRLVERLEKENMVGEVKRLRKGGVSPAPFRQSDKNIILPKKEKNKKLPKRCGVSWKRLEGFGLEYRHVSLYLRGKLSYDEMVEKLFIAIRQFAKRQMTWFKRDRKIKWVKKKGEAEKLVKKFLE